MRPRVIYIGGFSRSGTTLLQRLLEQLPGVVSLGEVCNLWDSALKYDDLCTCGESISRCRFWGEVAERAFGGWDAIDLHEVRRLRLLTDRARHLPELLGNTRSGRLQATATAYSSYYARIYAAALEVSGAEVVVDSSKRASLACCLSRSAAIDLRLVHIIRDSRGVAYSCTKKISRVDSVHGADLGTALPVVTSLNWVVHNVALEILGRRGLPTHRLTYEGFVDEPVRSFRELVSFAGLSADVDTTAFLSDDHVVLGTGHSIGGNPMRAQTGRVSLRLDDAWRARLPRADRLAVSALTYPLLRRYSRLPG
ncbi:sulfotransferase [Actinoallomurus spadix]|uniref:Sulfotransferase n=1 Tax=Actinoallomurus spadix TaxID=79912 RepID=A0ABN0WZA3_9ACTN|nr:sulfotransferase [Actinoallomurus spadix]MCO5989116.1 sulfotransferase [Actinoallomurus spadix]